MAVEEAFCPEGPTPDPLWQHTLDRLFKPDGATSWLHLYWEEGYAWEPIGRWMIGQVTPRSNVPDFVLPWLEGPNPATMGTLFEDEWHSTAPPISRRQWTYFQETGCYLQPYWVLQGTKGGHRYRLSRTEQVIIEAKGGNPEPPVPGDLPFAVPDQRTFTALVQRDRLLAHTRTIDFIEQSDTRLTSEAERDVRDMREELWTWHDRHSEETAEEAASQSARALWADMPSYEEAYPDEPSIDEKLEKLYEDTMTEGI